MQRRRILVSLTSAFNEPWPAISGSTWAETSPKRPPPPSQPLYKSHIHLNVSVFLFSTYAPQSAIFHVEHAFADRNVCCEICINMLCVFLRSSTPHFRYHFRHHLVFRLRWLSIVHFGLCCVLFPFQIRTWIVTDNYKLSKRNFYAPKLNNCYFTIQTLTFQPLYSKKNIYRFSYCLCKVKPFLRLTDVLPSFTQRAHSGPRPSML